MLLTQNTRLSCLYWYNIRWFCTWWFLNKFKGCQESIIIVRWHRGPWTGKGTH